MNNYHKQFRERFCDDTDQLVNGELSKADILAFIDEVVSETQLEQQKQGLTYTEAIVAQERAALIEKVESENKPCKHGPDVLCMNCGRSWLARDLLSWLREGEKVPATRPCGCPNGPANLHFADCPISRGCCDLCSSHIIKGQNVVAACSNADCKCHRTIKSN